MRRPGTRRPTTPWEGRRCRRCGWPTRGYLSARGTLARGRELPVFRKIPPTARAPGSMHKSSRTSRRRSLVLRPNIHSSRRARRRSRRQCTTPMTLRRCRWSRGPRLPRARRQRSASIRVYGRHPSVSRLTSGTRPREKRPFRGRSREFVHKLSKKPAHADGIPFPCS